MTTIYRGKRDYIIESESTQYQTDDFSFDALFQAENPADWLTSKVQKLDPAAENTELGSESWLPPLESQEIWAAGVTYFRSRTARMEEAESAGGDIFYDKVYDAERPELFFKATPKRARGHLAPIRIRKDSTWDVPEPELTLAINSSGQIFGFTIGNDMSSRSIEGENPLYLPQAKVYRGSCALGPGLVVGPEAVSPATAIQLEILRNGEVGFEGSTKVDQIKRGLDELAEFLFLENEFPDGALLMTGTGIVPDNDFTLQSGDVVRISIDGLGVLENQVE
ncbi:MAG: fumarylacetoacetate hydrolase family protein [Verrucomicrobiota bacterium]